jgi:hypothetical protein
MKTGRPKNGDPERLFGRLADIKISAGVGFAVGRCDDR